MPESDTNDLQALADLGHGVQWGVFYFTLSHSYHFLSRISSEIQSF